MSISGINNYNYPNYYAGARHNMAKTGGRDSGVLYIWKQNEEDERG